METSVRSLRRRVTFFSLFGIFVLAIALYGMHILVAQAFGVMIAGWIIYGTTAVCLVWSFIVALSSKEILTSSFKPIVSWYNGDKRRLMPVYAETKSAIDSVNEASKAMDVDISETLVADEGVVNAFMAGVGNRVVVFYRGLFQKLSPAGVRGVAFHEVAHAKNGDIFLTLMVVAFIQAFVFLSGLFWELAKWTAILTLFETDSEGKRKLKLERVTVGVAGGGYAVSQLLQFLSSEVMLYFFFAIALWLLANVIGSMIMSLISRNREYLADATATQYGAGRDLIQAFKEMSGIENTGRPSSNASTVARIGITPVPGSFLSVPSHPKMENRIKSIENLLDGKAGLTAGGFMFYLLVMFAGMFIGWLTLPLIGSQPYLLGLPVFYLGLLTLFAMHLFATFGYAEQTDASNSEPSSGGGAIFLLLVAGLILAGTAWVLVQIWSILGTIGLYYLIYSVSAYLLNLTISKRIKPFGRIVNLTSVVFAGYILFLLLF